MNEKLVMAEARYDEISAKLSDPAVIADNKLYRDLMREHKNLTPLMEVWQKYKKAQRGFDDAVEALNEARDSAIAEERRIQVGTGDRSERIRTYNFPQSRVTDHRIGLTLYKLDEMMNGGCDEVFEALRLADQTAKLLKQQ